MSEPGRRDEPSGEDGPGIQVQRRVDLPVDTVYALVTGPAGLSCWMGTGAPERLEEDASFELDDGTTGEIRIVEPDGRVRLTWHPDGWDDPSTLEVQVTEDTDGTTAIRFHHEGLPDAATREAMRAWWDRAIDALLDRSDASGSSQGVRP